jgi:hypothetical protein
MYPTASGGSAGVVEGGAHGPLGPLAARGGLGDVKRVVGGAVAREGGVHRGAAGLGVRAALEHHDPGALAHHEAVAAGVEGAAGAGGLVVAGGERAHGVEAADAQRGDGGLGAAGDHDVDRAAGDPAGGLAEAVGARGAGAGDAVVRAAEAEAHGDLARAEVGDGRGDEVGRELRRAAGAQGLVVVLDGLEAAHARAHDGAAAVTHGVISEARVGPGHLRGGEGELGEAVGLADLLRVDPAQGVEALHLRGDARAVRRRVEAGDAIDPAATGAEGGPGGGEVEAEGGDEADARDHDLSRGRHGQRLARREVM